MKLSIFSTALFLPIILAMPSDNAGSSNLEGRDNVKLNQYRTLDDW